MVSALHPSIGNLEDFQEKYHRYPGSDPTYQSLVATPSPVRFLAFTQTSQKLRLALDKYIGKGTPLCYVIWGTLGRLCSCLENPRDSRAWWAAVYGVAQSQTRLKQLSSSNRETSAAAYAPPPMSVFPPHPSTVFPKWSLFSQFHGDASVWLCLNFGPLYQNEPGHVKYERPKRRKVARVWRSDLSSEFCSTS